MAANPTVVQYTPTGIPIVSRPSTPFPGATQNFANTPAGTVPLSQETINAQAFPYHTFLVIDQSSWKILRQHTLIINPQEYTQQEPVRAQVVQTIGGAYVDDFGRGLPTVSMQGHTGWRLKPMPDGTGMQDGFQAFKALRNDVFRYFTDSMGAIRKYLRNPFVEMRWYNWAEDEFYSIQPTNFMLQRSVSQPLYYQYTFEFTCLASLTDTFARTGASTHGIAWLSGNSAVVTPASTKIGFDLSNLSVLAGVMRH